MSQEKRAKMLAKRKADREAAKPMECLQYVMEGGDVDSMGQVRLIAAARSMCHLLNEKSSWIAMASVASLREYLKHQILL